MHRKSVTGAINIVARRRVDAKLSQDVRKDKKSVERGVTDGLDGHWLKAVTLRDEEKEKMKRREREREQLRTDPYLLPN